MKTTKVNLLAALIATILVAGCATAIPMKGESKADATLKRDISRMVKLFAISGECKEFNGITTQVIKVNPPGEGKSQLAKKYGSVEERWIVSQCQQEVPYLITITPDGQGGAFFSTTKENVAK